MYMEFKSVSTIYQINLNFWDTLETTASPVAFLPECYINYCPSFQQY